MKVLVTGANGLIGVEVVKQLLAQGYDVRAIDIAPQTVLKDVEYAVCDVRDYAAVREQIRGCESIIHLAALPSPTFADGPTTFHINVTGTYNLYEAAAQEGIKRIAQASSVNAVGLTWNVGEFVPDYLPMDEGQSLQTSDPYSLSKELAEDIGAYFWRRSQISGVALRLPGVYPPSFYKSDDYYQLRDKAAGFVDEFLQLPEADRKRLLVKTRERVLKFRSERGLEFATKQLAPTQEELGDIPKMLWESYMWYRSMLWAWIDVRDAARAFILGLTAEYEGSHPLFINDTGNFAEYDASTLASLFYPDVSTHAEKLIGKTSLISIDKARDLIGFEPEYSVKA